MDRLVNIDVDDLDRAIEFYTSAFDFEIDRRFGTDAVELVGGSSPIYLLNKAAGTAATASATPLAAGAMTRSRRHDGAGSRCGQPVFP
jgi:predicted enzyme related to lactoylglutathione lyase